MQLSHLVNNIERNSNERQDFGDVWLRYAESHTRPKRLHYPPDAGADLWTKMTIFWWLLNRCCCLGFHWETVKTFSRSIRNTITEQPSPLLRLFQCWTVDRRKSVFPKQRRHGIWLRWVPLYRNDWWKVWCSDGLEPREQMFAIFHLLRAML